MEHSYLPCPSDDKPRLIAVIDTEEEFNWSKPFTREAVSVDYMRHIGRLQEVYDRFAIQPVYVVDYPVASQPAGWRPLCQLLQERRASIGAHLHPWVTPPYTEELSARNSYHGNLNKELERAKLLNLTERIEQSFGFRPTVFKAGRFGIGPNTLGLLSELGYEVDLSPAPPFDCSDDGGPDFSRMHADPFQDPATGLFVIPGTGAFRGWWPGEAATMHGWATTSWRKKLHVNSVFNRSGALRRLWLSPESFGASEMISLTQSLLKSGLRIFVISLHSTVVVPGATPFAATEQAVTNLLKQLNDYFQFFFGELQGEPWTPQAALECWSASPRVRGRP